VGEWHVKEPWQQVLLSNSSSRVVDDVPLQSRTLLHRSNIPFLTCGNKSIHQYIYLSTIRPDIFLIYMFKYNVLWLVLLICNSTINTISVYRGDELFFFMATGVSGENHRSDASHWQTLSHKIVSSTPRHGRASDCMGRCKSHYYMIAFTTKHWI
jgi:hypothetical protein